MKHQISIIIPTLNEAENISNLLHHLVKNSTKKYIAELIIVDGGSTDDSQDIITKFTIEKAPEINLGLENKPKIIWLNSLKGRAKQMNLGARNATGNILYFLHADSFPPKNFDQLIINEIKKGNAAGCFIMKFNSSHWWLKLAGFLTKLPWRVSRGGDQSLFITKTLFNTIGGYDENFTIYEDNNLISKLYAKKQFVVIQKWLTTSARCYSKHGVWKLQYHFWRIHIKHWLGADAKTLNNYYLKHIYVKK